MGGRFDTPFPRRHRDIRVTLGWTTARAVSAVSEVFADEAAVSNEIDDAL